MRDPDAFVAKIDEALAKCLWNMRHMDSAALAAALRSVLEAAEISNPRWRADEDEILSAIASGDRAFDRGVSASIGRDVHRRGLDQFLDQAFAPIMAIIRDAGPDASAAVLLMRDLRLAMDGERKLGRPRVRWGLVAAQEDAWGSQSSLARARARELQRSARCNVDVIEDAEGLRSCNGVILPDDLTGQALFLAGICAGARIPAVVVDPAGRGNPFGLPLAGSFEAALDFLRSGMPEGESPLDADSLMAEAALELSGMLKREEGRSVIAAVERDMDRQAARDIEIIKLVREHGIEKPFFDIYANGSRSGSEPIYAQRLNSARHQIQRLNQRLEEIEQANSEPPEPPVPMP